jgi:hypothetical protein
LDVKITDFPDVGIHDFPIWMCGSSSEHFPGQIGKLDSDVLVGFSIDLMASRAMHARVLSDLLRHSRRKSFGHISEPSDLIAHLMDQRVI